jgi:hypothetical protein
VLEAAAFRALEGWVRSPAYREAEERAGLARDLSAVEAFAERLAARR